MLVTDNQLELRDGFTLEHEGKIITVHQDDNPMSPRDWDNLSTMVLFHKRYDLGDPQSEHGYVSEDYESWQELREVIEAQNKVLAILPVYMYDHSVITINTTGFSCQWDSGQIGWAYITEERLQEMGTETRDKAELEEFIREEVKVYDQYLTGEVYGFVVETVQTCNLGHEHREHFDSCWGFMELEGLVEALNDNFREAK